MMVGVITGETIKSAIALKIKSIFATTSGTPPVTTYPTIYKEKIVQGMKKPCFFIWTTEVGQEKRMNNNYIRNYQMNIRYHPEDKNPKTYEELADIGNTLLGGLATIEVPIFLNRYNNQGIPLEDKKIVRGTQMNQLIQDDVLQVFVTYDIKINRVVSDGPHMNTLEIIQN